MQEHQDSGPGGDNPAGPEGRVDVQAARERLSGLAELGGGLPVGLWLPDEPGGPWAFLHATPLARLIDEANPSDRPCQAAFQALCQDVAVRGLPGSTPCPSREWRMEAWPIPAADGDPRPTLGCVVSARPVRGVHLPDPLMAARFRLDPEALAAVRAPAPDEEAERRAVLAHREMAREARSLGERAARSPAPVPAPRPRRGAAGRVLRKTTPHRVAGASTLQPLLDAMALEAVWIVDGAGCVRQANRTCRTWFGEDVVGRPCEEACGPSGPPCPPCLEATEAGADVVRRHEVERAGRRLDVTVYPILLDEEPRAASLLVARDVTERTRLEARLQEHAAELTGRRQELELILDCMGEGLLVTDDAGRIVRSNPIARMLFGMTPSELEGRELPDLLPATVRFAHAWDELTGHQVERIQEEVRISGARVADLQLTVARLAASDGASGGYVATMRDITRLKELDRLRDDFLSNVSHELRTPLATVRGFARTLRQDPGIRPEQRDEFLGLIDREAERLGRLIEDMLATARLESDGARLRTRPVDARTVMAELADLFRPACEERRVALEVAVPDGPALVTADQGLLRQLGHNLLGNASKFTPAGGRIQVLLERDGREVLLRVLDTGPGISDEEQPRVFEKFYRAPRTTRAVPGAGLGLAIVKRIVDAHGWRVGLRSEPGQGTEVWVRMRAAPTR